MSDASFSQDHARKREDEGEEQRARADGAPTRADRSAAIFGQSRAVFDATAAPARAARHKGEGGAGGGGDAAAAGSKAAAGKNLPIVVASLSATQTVRSGLNPGGGAFGLMDPTFTFRDVTHEVKDGKLHLQATMHCDYHWGVHSLGRKDVPRGDAPFITAKNYDKIANDIDPDKGTHTDSAPYQNYWSKKATEAHEKEHARDDWADWGAQNTGVNIAKKAWEAETVRGDHIDADLTKLQNQGGGAPRHPGKINTAVMDGSDVHYGASMAYYSRPGEIKAHAVGAAIERPLAAAVRAHGKKLEEEAKKKAEAAKAKADGAKAPATAPAGDDSKTPAPEGGKGAATPEAASTGETPPRHGRVAAIAGLFG